MRWAAKSDANSQEIVDALREAGAVVWHIKWPFDVLAGYRGQTICIEIKNPKGKNRHTDDQKKFMSTWTGGPVATVRDVEGALRVLRVVEKAECPGER